MPALSRSKGLIRIILCIDMASFLQLRDRLFSFPQSGLMEKDSFADSVTHADDIKGFNIFDKIPEFGLNEL